MDNKALLNFINEACKQDDSDSIDESIAELTSAIRTLEEERRKIENKKRSILIGNFKKAFLTLRENHINVAYDFEADYAHGMYDDFSDEVRLVLDDCDYFVFD